MKKLFYLLLLLALPACKEKTPTNAEYMNRALLSDSYKLAFANVKRVKDSLNLATTKPIDTNAVIFEYNMIGGIQKADAKTISQVKDIMKNEKDFLKSIQVSIADKMAKEHLDSLKN